MFLEINDNNLIEVWSETRGRKSDTFIYGWNIDDDELKNHLKNIKRSKGCNGSIKEVTKETGKIKVMHLQGNLKDYVVEYLIQNGIDMNNIKIKI
jgi:translation initiation factor 1 (eIF-1/SUI1)